MKKNIIKLLVIYGLLYSANNLFYRNSPQNQQHPTELPAYIRSLTMNGNDELLPFVYHFHPIEIDSRIEPVTKNRAYIEAMAKLETPDGDPTVINRAGYMGKFQMGRTAFHDIGIRMNPAKFRRHPIPEEIQDTMFLTFCALNRYYLQDEIRKYQGQRIRGIRMSEANILAGAHLGGVGSMKRYLNTRGRHDFADGNGTHVSYYLKKFEHHTLDLSNVQQPSVPN